MNRPTNQQERLEQLRNLISAVGSTSFPAAIGLRRMAGELPGRPEELDAIGYPNVAFDLSTVNEVHRLRPDAVGLLRGLETPDTIPSSVAWKKHPVRGPGLNDPHGSCSLLIFPSVAVSPCGLTAWKLVVGFKNDPGDPKAGDSFR